MFGVDVCIDNDGEESHRCIKLGRIGFRDFLGCHRIWSDDVHGTHSKDLNLETIAPFWLMLRRQIFDPGLKARGLEIRNDHMVLHSYWE